MKETGPERTCAGCGAKAPKARLLRVCCKSGDVGIDENGKAPGRGAYLCRDAGCASRARKRDALSRSLKVRVPHRIYDELDALLETRVSSSEDRKKDGWET